MSGQRTADAVFVIDNCLRLSYLLSGILKTILIIN